MMEFSRNMQKVMERAVKLAGEKGHRYFMPEHMIYGMTFDEDFFEEYQAFGGDIGKLRRDVLEFLDDQAGQARGDKAVLTADTDRVIRMCEGQARSSGRSAIDVSHFLSAVMQLHDCYGVYYLAVQGVDLVQVAGEMSRSSLARERDGGPEGEEHREDLSVQGREAFGETETRRANGSRAAGEREFVRESRPRGVRRSWRGPSRFCAVRTKTTWSMWGNPGWARRRWPTDWRKESSPETCPSPLRMP